MNVILDTNILRQDFSLRSSKYEALFSYLKKTDSKLILPDVVVREALNLFKREMQSNISKAKSISEKLAKISFSKSTGLNCSCDMTEEIKQYKQMLDSPREFIKTQVLPSDPSYFDETITRIIEGTKPASGTGGEFRDVIIWISIKDYLQKNKLGSTTFISANTNEFADDAKKGLSPQLLEEVALMNSRLFYYTSIENFLKEEAIKIDGITKEWINAHISEVQVEKIACRYLESRGNRLERYAAKKENNFSGDISILSVSPSLDNFFVYDMHSDGLYLNMSYYAEVEIEIGLDEPDYDEDSYPHRGRSMYSHEHAIKCLSLEVYLNYSAKVVDDKIIDLDLDDWDFA